MDTNKLITFIKFSFLLFVFTLSTYASSQEVEVVVRVKEVIEDDESEDEVFEINIDGRMYYTNNDQNGDIYDCLSNYEIGNIVGQFKDKKSIFF